MSEVREIAQMGELGEFMQGHITGAFVVVESPDGTRHRVTRAGFEPTSEHPEGRLVLYVTAEPDWSTPNRVPDMTIRVSQPRPTRRKLSATPGISRVRFNRQRTDRARCLHCGWMIRQKLDGSWVHEDSGGDAGRLCEPGAVVRMRGRS